MGPYSYLVMGPLCRKRNCVWNPSRGTLLLARRLHRRITPWFWAGPERKRAVKWSQNGEGEVGGIKTESIVSDFCFNSKFQVPFKVSTKNVATLMKKVYIDEETQKLPSWMNTHCLHQDVFQNRTTMRYKCCHMLQAGFSPQKGIKKMRKHTTAICGIIWTKASNYIYCIS